jgi:hypothetical protein
MPCPPTQTPPINGSGCYSLITERRLGNLAWGGGHLRRGSRHLFLPFSIRMPGDPRMRAGGNILMLGLYGSL